MQTSAGPKPRGPSRIGIGVAPGAEDLGRALFARIVRGELQRRLPAAAIRCFGVGPYVHPEGLDGGEPLEALGSWSLERAGELADQLDCLIVGGGDVRPVSLLAGGLGPELGERCPVMWLSASLPADPTPDEAALLRTTLSRMPYGSVRDEVSKRRLAVGGIDRHVEVVPDPVLLAPRHFDPEVLEKRLEYLRLMGWYPDGGKALVVQGDRELGRSVPDLVKPVTRLLEERDDLSIVLAELSPPRGDQDFAEMVSEALPVAAYRIPSEVEVEDWVAALAAATGFVGTSLPAGIVALAYGRPFLILNLDGRLDGSGLGPLEANASFAEDAEAVTAALDRMEASAPEPDLAHLRERLDQHFDRIADIARGVKPGRGSEPREPFDPDTETALLRIAHDVLSRRLAAERVLFADIAASFRPEVARLEEEVATLEQQLGRLKSRRIFRYSAPLRHVYAALRRWLGLQP